MDTGYKDINDTEVKVGDTIRVLVSMPDHLIGEGEYRVYVSSKGQIEVSKDVLLSELPQSNYEIVN